MKKALILTCLLMGSWVSTSWADARTDLQQRLNQVSNLSAEFTQRVTSAEGTLIQEGQGKLLLQRPALFRWHMTSPDESLLISDGKALWFFDPLVEQVTVANLNDATENTPFILISRNNSADWNRYQILQVEDKFELTPKKGQKNLKAFSINVDKKGIITSFEAKELDGQKNLYLLKNQKNSVIDKTQFTFTAPKGVIVDDRR